MDICKLIKEQPAFKCYGGVDEKAIKSAEDRLGCWFANEYRAYLAEFGAAYFYSHELTGLNCPRYIDVVDITMEQRELLPDDLSDLYVIEEAHIDGIIYWQNAAGEVFKTVPNSQPVKLFASLLEYISQTKIT